ncbi:MAG: TetR/AcrR family transcriptional regulator [Xanthobacteraceae bacterium]|jgi:AcrR family transcriptional regulator
MDARRSSSDPSPWESFETRRRARDEKRDAVLRTAVQLFLEQGYHRATLNDVAERLNITKPALYNYFRSKEEILFECWMLGQERVDDCIAEIEAGGGTGLAKLRKLVRGYAEAMASDFGASLVRFNVRDLSEANQKRTLAGKRRIDQVFRGYIAQGIADGSIGPCDVKLTAFAIAGSLNWIGHWFKHGGALSAGAIADDFAVQLTKGLESRPSRTRPSSKPAKAGRSKRGGPS